jgi:hypothetical protein
MGTELSFLNHPFLTILEHANRLFPGMEKTVAIYWDFKADMLKAKIASRLNETAWVEDIDIGDKKVVIQKLRNSNEPIDWFSRSSIPFEVVQSDPNQYRIFSEMNDSVLLLRFANDHDKMFDLLFLYLAEGSNTFGLSRYNIPIGLDHKSMIGFLMYNTVNGIIHIGESDNTIYKRINSNTLSMISSYHALQDKHEKTNKNFGLSLVNQCKHYLHEFSVKYGKTFELDEKAFSKITAYKGEIDILRQIIEDAVIFAIHLNSHRRIEHIVIEDAYINLKQQDPPGDKQEKVLILEERYAKTILMLDRLEKSASDLYERNMALTGKNVGKNCSKSISAAAISDALSNHKRIVRYLFEKYPEKWTVIRNHFRPVKNILVDRSRTSATLSLTERNR